MLYVSTLNNSDLARSTNAMDHPSFYFALVGVAVVAIIMALLVNWVVSMPLSEEPATAPKRSEGITAAPKSQRGRRSAVAVQPFAEFIAKSNQDYWDSVQKSSR